MITHNMLGHLVEEDLQHRGELRALLWQMDIEAPTLGWEDCGSRFRPAQPPCGVDGTGRSEVSVPR